MNFFQWLCIVFNWASETDKLKATYYPDDKFPGEPREYTEGLSDFLDLAADQYARLMVYGYADNKRFGKKRFNHERDYFAVAVLRLLTEFSPVYSNLTIRLRYFDSPWVDLRVDGHEWSFGKEFPDDTKDTYHETPWGIEYTNWNEWLGMTVDHEFFEMSADIILAHVVWEMTYNGMPGTKEYESRMKWLNESGEPKSCDGIPLSYPDKPEEGAQ
jgi:hypothetical protein